MIGCAAEPEGLVVDAAANSWLSDGNGMLEPGETVIVNPSWKNQGGGVLSLSGTAFGLTGPAGAMYTVGDSSADYGSIAVGATNDCGTATGNCYALGVSNPASRPATHWDATFTETLSDGDPARVWTLHIGQSFTDVPKTHTFYPYIYGTGVTTGCEPGKYCPDPDVTRAQMAMFVARAIAGSDAAVPQAYGPDPLTGRSYSCNPGSPNLHFTDVTTGDIFCRHTHYLWAKDVISGFPDNTYQPAAQVTRGAMAKFLANGFNLRLYGP